MQDRVPVNPGRVLITPENNGEAYYATLSRADNPTQEGTPLNKSTFLKDQTALLFGFDPSATPNDVFASIYQKLFDLKVLLWQNASPQSTFVAQTINLDLSEYTHVCVTANNSYLNECALVGGTIIPVGASTVLLGTFNSYLVWRVVETSVNGVSIQSGLATAAQVDDRLLIPYQIYGIKVVSQ